MNSPVTPPVLRGKHAAIFDVDGTLCDTRSTTSLVWLRQRQHSPWRHRLWLASLLWRGPFAMIADTISRQWADRLVYSQYAGLSLQRAEHDAQRCCDELLLPSCFPDALAEIARHQQAGRRVILLSGGVDLVLKPLAKALRVELLAQRLIADGDCLTGRHRTYQVLDDVLRFASQAESKLQALKRYAEATGIDLSVSSAYGDSINDAAVLSAVGHPVAVNPSRRLMRIARERGWQVRRWRLAG